MHPVKVSEKTGSELLRIGALDALRMTAAVIVFREHFYVVFDMVASEYPSFGLLDAKAAVTLFFVLSGYVLAISLSRSEPSLKQYVNFGIRRFFRIYPLYWVALLVTFCVLVWVRTKPDFTYAVDMPSSFLDAPGLQLKQWLLQMTLMAPGMVSFFAMPTVWTLMVEAKVAIIFPLLAWVLLRTHWAVATAVLAGLVLGAGWLMDHVVGTALFLGQFGLGVMLHRLPAKIWAKMNTWTWCLFLLASIALYRTMSLRLTFSHDHASYYHYACALGSAGFIVCTLHWPMVRSFFERIQKALRYDLSYGLYILHYPVMIALRGIWLEGGRTLPLSVLCLLSVTLTVSLAYALHRVVELPAIRLGRRLTFR